ncbi:hypothetical protein FQA47_003791 [Oryzias melastigma]|uniref:Uncharacterized protein n=1 Tax=Oryzias melastigma TaxID=30732 RepID=A0A834FDI2_ORYME|nr:hypothetical protein FQA47_003791 [Oryzias melastigma]
MSLSPQHHPLASTSLCHGAFMQVLGEALNGRDESATHRSCLQPEGEVEVQTT